MNELVAGPIYLYTCARIIFAREIKEFLIRRLGGIHPSLGEVHRIL
jgi:hypothetical protein